MRQGCGAGPEPRVGAMGCHFYLRCLEEEDPPVSRLQLEHVGLLLVVGGLGRQRVVHAHGVFQVLLRQGLLWLIFVL